MKTKSTPLVEWDMSNDITILPIAQRLRGLSATHYHRGIFEDDTLRAKWVNDAQVTPALWSYLCWKDILQGMPNGIHGTR